MMKILNNIISAFRLSRLNDSSGVTIVLVTVLMLVLIGITALAIDVGHLLVVRGELQNAADAGALHAAHELYNDYGTEIQTSANQEGYDAATENKALSEAGAIPVDLDLGADVQRGHWSFATREFTPNDSTIVTDLWGVSTEDLDTYPEFINAVRVVARRRATPAASFFARIFGYANFTLSAEAIGYIGFAGKLAPGEVDQPLAICEESILSPEGDYDCSIGRMINSGQNEQSNETGGWTSFSQDDPCSGGTNAQEVSGLICGGGNPDQIDLGAYMATNGGEIQSAFNNLIACWIEKTNKQEVWNLTLPVVSCPGNNVGTCEEVKGAVNLNIVWITGPGENSDCSKAPTQMGDWPAEGAEFEDDCARWDNFVTHFNLRKLNGDLATAPDGYKKKSIYFLPDCSPHELAGTTGGENYGVLARIPVLVR